MNIDDITASELLHRLNSEEPISLDRNKIDVCNVCEYRYICTNDHVLTQREENLTYYKELECEYNPFIGKWKSDSDYLSLNECGIQSTPEKLEIDHLVLSKVKQKMA